MNVSAGAHVLRVSPSLGWGSGGGGSGGCVTAPIPSAAEVSPGQCGPVTQGPSRRLDSVLSQRANRLGCVILGKCKLEFENHWLIKSNKHFRQSIS